MRCGIFETLGENELKPHTSELTHGFSLLELMIVIVIIGILAAIGVPMYLDSVYSAKRAEAIAAMGSIRSELNWYYAEYGWYPIEDKDVYVIGASWNHIKPGELTGNNFSDSSYYYKCKDGEEWEIKVKKKTSFLEKDLKLKHDGSIKGG